MVFPDEEPFAILDTSCTPTVERLNAPAEVAPAGAPKLTVSVVFAGTLLSRVPTIFATALLRCVT